MRSKLNNLALLIYPVEVTKNIVLILFYIVLLLKAKDLLFGIIHAVLIPIFIKMIKIN